MKDTKRILLVEDDIEDAELFIRASNQAIPGVELVHEVTLAAALSRLETESFDVIVTDLGLPDGRGTATVRPLRKVAPETTLVVLTGSLDEEQGILALRAGAHDFLTKDDASAKTLGRVIRHAYEHHQVEEQLRTAARRDPLTKLPNRRALEEVLGLALKRRTDSGQGHSVFSVLYIDLDGFKAVNDNHGHDAGDWLLCTISERLSSVLRDGDTLARLGGDEFAVVVTGDAEQVRLVAQRILDTFDQSMNYGGHQLDVGASIGIAHAETGVGPDTLLRLADGAMYQAKRDGRGCYRSAAPHTESNECLSLPERLRESVERKDFAVEYSPTISTRGGQPVQLEAAARWQLGEQSFGTKPEDLVPLLEASGEIVEVGYWLLEQACRDCSVWRGEGISVLVVVSISALQFAQDDFADQVLSLTQRAGIHPSNLLLELNEGLTQRELEVIAPVVSTLRASLVKVRLGDFGAGTLPFQHLSRLHVDAVRISDSIIRQATKSRRDEEILRMVTQLARLLGCSVVASGVMEEKELRLLARLGCDLARGEGLTPASESWRELLKHAGDCSSEAA